MKLRRKEPKKVTRKSSEVWTQNCEIDFILYDLPVECVKLGFDFKSTITKHINGLKKGRCQRIGIVKKLLNMQPML